jgi:protocatechuate 3,4-dioxygenase, beta subunit
MKYLIPLALFFSGSLQSCAQSSQQAPQNGKKVGGSCEGCEAIYESPIPFSQLSFRDTLPDYNDQGQKLHLSGVVHQSDGRTPAPGVVLYIYHTDQTGVYPTRGDEKGWARRHGYIRGWIKTNDKGAYAFYTLRPAAYPNRQAEEHIHAIVKEPDKNDYWIDEYVFADDPLLTQEMKTRMRNRGGSGILEPQRQGNILVAHRDIILGKNVPDYQ